MNSTGTHKILRTTDYAAYISKPNMDISESIIYDYLKGHGVITGIDSKAITSIIHSNTTNENSTPTVVARAQLISLEITIQGISLSLNDSSLKEFIDSLSVPYEFISHYYANHTCLLSNRPESNYFIEKNNTILSVKKRHQLQSIFNETITGTDIAFWLPASTAIRIKETDEYIHYIADISGYLSYDGSGLTIVSPIVSTYDSTELSYICFPTKNQPEMISHLSKELAAQSPDANREKKIESVITNLNNHQLYIAILKTGKAPVHGQESILRIKVKQAFKPQENERSINYRDITPYQPITTGTIIAELLPGFPSQSGIDINGNTIEAPPVSIISFTSNKNVLVKQKNGTQVLIAKISGVLDLDDTHADVMPTLIIDGDVNQKTGNISHDSAIIVKGSLTSGFSISTPSIVIIENSIEKNSAISCKHLTVIGGISGPLKNVSLSGNLTTGYIQNCTLRLPGSLLVYKYIFNSNIFAHTSITVQGNSMREGKKGCVIGGVLNCFHSIALHSAGSSLEKTKIIAGIDNTLLEQYQKVLLTHRSLVLAIRQHQNSNTGYSLDALTPSYLASLDGATQARIKDRLITLKKILYDKQQLEKTMAMLQSRLHNPLKSPPTIHIMKRIIPDTHIQICQAHHTITKEEYTTTYTLVQNSIESQSQK